MNLEKELLGTVIILGSAEKIAGKLERENFVREENWQTYKAMVDLEKISPAILREKTGFSAGYFANLMNAATCESMLPILIKQMKARSWKRKVIVKLDPNDLGRMEPGQIREQLQKCLAIPGIKIEGEWNLGAALQEVIDFLENKVEGEMIKTGFYDLDKIIGGWIKGKFYIIAGRPSHGKSCFVLSQVLRIAKKRKKCLVYSLDDPIHSALLRLIAMQGEVNNSRFKYKDFSPDDYERILKASARIRDLPIIFSTHIQPTVWQIREEIEKYKPEVVVVDYIGLVSRNGIKGENRNQILGEVGNQFKIMAKEFNIVFLCVVQLNRAASKREQKVPILSDIRDSGELEESASVVIFLYYPYKYDREKYSKNEIYLIVAKQKDGGLGAPKLGFNPQFYQFYNLEREK